MNVQETHVLNVRDTTVFTLEIYIKSKIGVVVHVDNKLAYGTMKKCLDQVYTLSATLPIKDLRVVDKFLELRINQLLKNGYEIDQNTPIVEILIEFRLLCTNSVTKLIRHD